MSRSSSFIIPLFFVSLQCGELRVYKLTDTYLWKLIYMLSKFLGV